jgi:hypothetical protein
VRALPLFRAGVTAAALAAAALACTTANHGLRDMPMSNRIKVYEAVMEEVLRHFGADLAVVDPKPITHYLCGCESGRRDFIARELTTAEPDTIAAFCSAPSPAPLTEIELRQLGKPGPLQSALGRRTTPLAFSAFGLSRNHDQALVGAAELDAGRYWLLRLQRDTWVIEDSTFAWED